VPVTRLADLLLDVAIRATLALLLALIAFSLGLYVVQCFKST
jgi:hypothetical protein